MSQFLIQKCCLFVPSRLGLIFGPMMSLVFMHMVRDILCIQTMGMCTKLYSFFVCTGNVDVGCGHPNTGGVQSQDSK